VARKGWYIGKTRVGWYEVGRDPKFFEKWQGFRYKDFVCDLPKDFVEKVLKPPPMEVGDVVRIKPGSLKLISLTKHEKEELEKWKSQFSIRPVRPKS
jgi:hypothetical protein